MKAPWHLIRKKPPSLLQNRKFASFVDKMIYFVGIVTPLMTIPQVWSIWGEKAVGGVSIASWITYLLASICWLLYGTIHKDKPIFYTQIIWIVLSAMVVVGLIVYA